MMIPYHPPFPNEVMYVRTALNPIDVSEIPVFLNELDEEETEIQLHEMKNIKPRVDEIYKSTLTEYKVGYGTAGYLTALLPGTAIGYLIPSIAIGLGVGLVAIPAIVAVGGVVY